ncbi:hypothetical protein GF386_03825 [Candidatus Pacearchaeota archaeon]|nr:hypothetical protein [Candidatus Pacearchaeota archaeon]MBD3283275.1 hypothetical protein [Candidatus Pacearchaeota archaeon]
MVEGNINNSQVQFEKKELKKIGVFSLAKISGLAGVIFGLIAGIMFFIFASLIGSLATIASASSETGSIVPAGIFMGGGVFMLISMPIFYGLICFIGGALSAFIYNLVAGWIGGVEFNFI